MNEAPAIKITKHAALRGEERLRLNHGALLRLTRQAMLCGMPMAETKGDLWHHMEAKMLLKGGLGNMTRIHQNVVFIIHDHRLITVYHLPQEHRPQVAKWCTKNPPPAKSSGSLKDRHSGVTALKTGQGGLQSLQKAIKRSKISRVTPRQRSGGAA